MVIHKVNLTTLYSQNSLDDIIVIGDKEEEIKSLKGNLAKEFEIKDFGELKYFLGMEIARTKRELLFPKENILEILKKPRCLDAKQLQLLWRPIMKLVLMKKVLLLGLGDIRAWLVN